MALRVTSGGFGGRGIAASTTFLAFTNSTGSSVLGAMYWRRCQYGTQRNRKMETYSKIIITWVS